jgi:tRNA threonylcarbamoyladenosine biosynthesis protein TsaB
VIILGIDTAGPGGGVALIAEQQVLASVFIRQPAAFSRLLLPCIDRLLAWTGYTLTDLTGLVVNVGPGVFTGLRIGLATAQGLAMACGKPLVGCSTFEALLALVPYWEGAICPVIEARRGEVYAALYYQQGGQVQERIPGMVVAPEALCALLEDRTLFLGSGVKLYGATFLALLGDRAVCMDTGLEEVGLAVSLARVAQSRLQAAPAEVAPIPKPLYIRPADARLPRHAAQENKSSSLHWSAPLEERG